ncbi:MAG: DVUA0089 family protein, partial [Planctomycetota bacterium]
ATITPAGDNNDLTITAVVPGLAWEGIDVVLVNSAASGNQAIVTFDAGAATLTIDVDPLATTANTVMAEINAEGTFAAALDATADPGNDGTGLIAEVGTVETTAAVRSASITPAGDNNDVTITSVAAGPAWEGIDIVLVYNAAVGDQAIVTFDAGAGALTIDIDPLATTANSVIAAVNAEGTFTAALDATVDLGNDGTGLIAEVGTASTTAAVRSATITLAGDNNDLAVSAVTPGPAFDGIDLVFMEIAGSGDVAFAGFDATAGELVIAIDTAATTANTVVSAINAEGTFTAVLDTAVDLTNDGSGLIAPLGVMGTASITDYMNVTVSAVPDPLTGELTVTFDGPVVFLDLGTSLMTPVGSVDLPGEFTSVKVDGSLLHVIGHTVPWGGSGPLPYYNELLGDHIVPNPGPPERFHHFGRGQDNLHEGFYIDDLIIGFAERGEMLTAQLPKVSTYQVVPPPPTEIHTGDYQLEIRRSTEYGGDDPSSSGLTLYRAYDTNDRMTQGITLLTLDPWDIFHGREFSISDGVNTASFEFVDPGIGSSGEGVPIFFDGTPGTPGSATAAEIADLVVEAINSVTWLDVSASSILTSNRVDLFGAAGAEGIDFIVFGDDPTNIPVSAESGDVIPLAIETELVAGSSGAFSAQADVGDGLDVDFFAFDLDVGDYITADIDARDQGSPLDSVLRLFDANGVELTFSDDDPAPGEIPTFDSFLGFTALTAGRYFVGVSGFSNFGYDPFVSESGSGSGWNSTGAYGIELLLNGAPPPPSVSLISSDKTDTNLHRDQGYTVIEANEILNSEEYAIVVDASDRDSAANQVNPTPVSGLPGLDGDADAGLGHLGSVAPLREINTQRLVPGMMIENNVIAYGGLGGIFFSGDPNPAGTPTAAVPFGRIVNNTIYGAADPAAGAQSLIDFETIPGGVPSEGMTIDNQFLATHGVTFSYEDGTFPILAELGLPLYAFGYGPFGSPLGDEMDPAETTSVGQFFLADSDVGWAAPVAALRVDYAPLTDAASGVVLD